MKKNRMILLTLCLALAASGAQAQTLNATTDGRNGPLSVAVEYTDGVIEGIDITGHSETPSIADGAIERIPMEIVAAQSLNVDAVAGATITSNAILAAVEDCLSQAGADIEALKAVEAVPVEKKLTAGTYRGMAHGHHSDVFVDVVVDETSIQSVAIAEEGETYNIGDAAFERVPASIVEAQSIAVDTVAGATYTSQAIINAVADALKQAGGEEALAAFSTRIPEDEQEKNEIAETYDVVVVGSGIAGVSAALSAQEAGANVALLEKLPYTGGVSQTAAGGFVYPDENDAEHYKEFLYNRTIGNQQGRILTPNSIISTECVDALADRSTEAVQWMIGQGVQIEDFGAVCGDHLSDLHEDGTYSPLPALDYERIWTENFVMWAGAEVPDTGAYAMMQMVDNFRKLGGTVYLETPATELIVKDGAVAGVKAEGKNARYTFNAKAVILCAGGFGASAERVAKYAPAYIGEINNTLVGNTGDGIAMAETIGAAVYEDAYMMGGTAHTVVTDMDMIAPYVDHETPMTAMYVNPQGIRINSENPEAYANSILHVNPHSRDYYWIIMNEEVASSDPAYYEILKNGLENEPERFFTSDKITGLANQIGMVPNTLIYSLDLYNDMCEKGVDTALFKADDFLVAMNEGPWYAVKAYMLYFGTVGGLVTNGNAEVLDTDNNVIKGLYAAGENSNHGVFARCYSGGVSLPEALTFGRIAGLNAAKLISQ